MGASGTDLMLSPKARSVFPYAVECKNVERVSFFDAMNQAEANARKVAGLSPLLVLKRNGSETYVALRFEDFLAILGNRTL